MAELRDVSTKAITNELISEALNLLHPSKAVKIPFQLMDLDKKATFINELGKHETFKDLVHKEIALPMQLYSQHVTLGKPQKYTQLHRRISNFIRKIVMGHQKQKWSQILADLVSHKQSKGLRSNSHVGAGLLLTQGFPTMHWEW